MKSKPAPTIKSADGSVNKSATIRELIKSGLKMPGEISAALEKRGIKCHSSLIHQVLYPNGKNGKAKERDRNRKRAERAAEREARESGGVVTERRKSLTKAAAIRELVKAGKSPVEIVAELAKRKIDASPIDVYRVTSYDRRGGAAGDKRRRAKPAHVSTNGEATKTEIDRAFEIAKEFGGVRQLQAVLKKLRKLVR